MKIALILLGGVIFLGFCAAAYILARIIIGDMRKGRHG